MHTVLQQSVLCTHTHSIHCTIGLCSIYQNAAKDLMENQLIYCIIKYVIYKYPPSFLTLHAYYKLVCYTVLIEAMCAAIFPQKTTTTVCLGFCFHTSSMLLTHCPTNDLYHEVLQSKVRLGLYDKDIFAMEVRKGNTSAWYFCVFSFFLIYIPD